MGEAVARLRKLDAVIRRVPSASVQRPVARRPAEVTETMNPIACKKRILPIKPNQPWEGYLPLLAPLALAGWARQLPWPVLVRAQRVRARVLQLQPGAMMPLLLRTLNSMSLAFAFASQRRSMSFASLQIARALGAARAALGSIAALAALPSVDDLMAWWPHDRR